MQILVDQAGAMQLSDQGKNALQTVPLLGMAHRQMLQSRPLLGQTVGGAEEFTEEHMPAITQGGFA